MANLSITAASVLASATAIRGSGIAGATITQGQPVYSDAADSNKLKPCDSNVSAALAACVGIALVAASAGQPVTYAVSDTDFTPGATLTVGESYYVASTAGSIAPVGDITTGDFPTFLFVAKSTTKAVLKLVSGGVVKP
jgi:hypothetical protein